MKNAIYKPFIVLMSLLLIACSNKTEALELKTEEVTLELGQTIDEVKAKDILNTDDKVILKSSKIILNNKDVKELEVKTYKATITYKIDDKEFSSDFTVKVVDTTAPIFKDYKEVIEIEEGVTEIDYNSLFTADDLSEVTIEVDSSKVDLSKVGEYEIKITATDKYKNRTEKTSKIVVTAKVEEVVETTVYDTNNSNTNTSGDSTGSSNSVNTNNGTGTNIEPTPNQPQVCSIPEGWQGFAVYNSWEEGDAAGYADTRYINGTHFFTVMSFHDTCGNEKWIIYWEEWCTENCY